MASAGSFEAEICWNTVSFNNLSNIAMASDSPCSLSSLSCLLNNHAMSHATRPVELT